ncbi:hypothetical protein P9112_007458 [Eukaryota sp. TZLM1-RC]
MVKISDVTLQVINRLNVLLAVVCAVFSICLCFYNLGEPTFPRNMEEIEHFCQGSIIIPSRLQERKLPVIPWFAKHGFRFQLDSVPLLRSRVSTAVNSSSTPSLTLTTFFSFSRRERFYSQVQAFSGPVKAVLLIRPNHVEDLCTFIDSEYFTQLKQRDVSIDVVFGYTDILPINSIRNHVIRMVETTHQIWLDVDFIPSPGLVHAPLPSVGEVYIVPAFEQPPYAAGIEVPSTKTALLSLLNIGLIDTFDHIFPVAHNLTRYDVWQNSGSIIPTAFNDPRNEPYFITHRLTTPPFDERFPYGFRNKMQHSSHLQILNFQPFVLPEEFLVHLYHPPTSESRLSVLWNKGLNWRKLHQFYGHWEHAARQGLLFNSFEEYLKY